MATTSRETTYIEGGLPTINDIDANLWGTGTEAARPVTGDGVGDIYIVVDTSGQIYRFDVWDGSAWASFQADPIGATSGTQGDLLIRNATQWGVLSPGTSGQFLQTQGASSDPVWADAAVPGSEIAEANGDITTTSTTDVIATSMTITPAAGTYLVWFSGALQLSANNSTGFLSIHVDGAQETGSERELSRGSGAAASNSRVGFCSTARVTVNGSEQIEGRWRVSAGTGTLESGRTLMIVEVGT